MQTLDIFLLLVFAVCAATVARAAYILFFCYRENEGLDLWLWGWFMLAVGLAVVYQSFEMAMNPWR